MEKATEQDYKRINRFFSVTSWSINSDTLVLKTNNLEKLIEFLGYDIDDLEYERIRELVDVGNIWFDADETENYYMLIGKNFME